MFRPSLLAIPLLVACLACSNQNSTVLDQELSSQTDAELDFVDAISRSIDGAGDNAQQLKYPSLPLGAHGRYIVENGDSPSLMKPPLSVPDGVPDGVGG